MIPNERGTMAVPAGGYVGRSGNVAQLKAANCDLCDAEGEFSSPDPACVAACPHDAAHRWTGPELLAHVMKAHAPDLSAAGLRGRMSAD